VRYTIHPEARKEILKRLLELNHKIHEEEVQAGLWEKKKSGGQSYKSRQNPMAKQMSRWVDMVGCLMGFNHKQHDSTFSLMPYHCTECETDLLMKSG
jgi:hypothetical protein